MSKFAPIFVFTASSLGAFGQQVENTVVVGDSRGHWEGNTSACYEGMQPVDYSLRSERDEK